MEEILNIKSRFESIKNHLDEKTKRLFCAAEAKVLGRGGIKKVYKATNVSEKTISKGLKELNQIDTLDKKENKIRKSGGGRKKAIDKNPDIEKHLLALVEPTTRGEPESPLLWTTKLANSGCEAKFP
jgi:hypothetical protein